MIVQVMYGTAEVDRALSCTKCRGKKYSDPEVGERETCKRCEGTGIDPNPHTYAYSVPAETPIGALVECPPPFWDTTPNIGRVVLEGRGDYDGPVREARVLAQVDSS